MSDSVEAIVRAGLAAEAQPKVKRRRYIEDSLDLGQPQVDLTKALTLAAELEDEEVIRKLQLRK